jgi:hypothetical protein
MESKFIKCNCHAHAIELQYDEDDNCVYLGIWNYGNFNRDESLWKRIKVGFRYIFTKKLYGDHVILGLEEAAEMNEFVKTHLKNE